MTEDRHILYPNVQLGASVSIGEYSVLGRPPRRGRHEHCATPPSSSVRRTVIGANCDIGSHVLVEAGAQIEDGSTVESGSIIEALVSIGSRSFVVHGARLCAECRVGSDCVIGGFIGERAVIGTRSRVFGKLVHRQLDPTTLWDATPEPAPVLDADVFVGVGALIVGPSRIGPHVYVAAGAIVTRDVPAFSVVVGVNRIIAASQWRGNLSLERFWRSGQ